MECLIKNTRVYYEVYGEGLPIINLHGFMLDHRVLKGCMEPIFSKRSNFKRIYFDLPGCCTTIGMVTVEETKVSTEIALKILQKS